MVKLNQKLSAYKRAYLVGFSNLQESVDSLEIDKVSCDDLFDIKPDLVLTLLSKHSKLKELEYKLNSSKAFSNVYNSYFQSISYEAAFEQELDAKRYTIGINIPITSLSSEKEKRRARHLHMSSAYSEQKASMHRSITSASQSLSLKLEALYDEYVLLKDEILPLNIELVKLSKSAYDEGEASIMEYIDVTRSNSENILEMLEVKKNYYYELFELYKIADIDLGENYAQ